MSRIGENLRVFKEGVDRHNRMNPKHPPAHGIGLSGFDLNRLGFDDGEELWSGVRIVRDGGCTGNFRVICDADGHRPTEVTFEDWASRETPLEVELVPSDPRELVLA